ncbi:carbohydrate-binding module family 50 protein [Karstenula rhodostoma CBS 690.94]|uniref:Carbohydrate-binding module family 50 protein n=1 Tax=Karstenula rhodostoma CBS 690.94 TaxID=1392251 RepID=A0A9P4PH01_9PLEO|nr:carbohydrate-binding module family 50 protein [Karstenula rhodostoma CBS 690.94]
MFTASYIIAASQLFAFALGAPILSASPKQARSLVARTAYKVFGGDGTPAQGWPQESEWKSFEDLWSANVDTTLKSCSQFGQDNNSQEESDNIKKAIEEVAGTSGVKAEFILSIVLQESKGCVRAPTTNYGYDNPGLMQSFQGTHSCNPDGNGVVPCPYDSIKGMIEDGAGLNGDVGLKEGIAQAGSDDVSKYYKAARIYNSGSLVGDNLNVAIATRCYSTDVANRLIGWTDADSHDCDEATIGNVGAGAPSSAPAGPSDSGETTTPVDTTTPPPPAPAPATGGCSKNWTPVSGDNCSTSGVDFATFQSLNPSIDSNCANLQPGTSYCVAA